MKKITEQSKLSMNEKETYICSSEEFNEETKLEDGTVLMVVDETEHEVSGYYIAFNGYWNSL